MREIISSLSEALGNALQPKKTDDTVTAATPVAATMSPVKKDVHTSRPMSAPSRAVIKKNADRDAERNEKLINAARENAGSAGSTEAVVPPAESGDENAGPEFTPGTQDDVKVEDERSLAISGGLHFSGDLLTAEGGPLKIPDESRNLCALFDTGLWLVSASHRHSPLVTSVAQAARRMGYQTDQPRYVTPNIIRQAYVYATRQAAVEKLDNNAVRRRIVEMLERAVEMGANDIHIEASDDRTRIEFRIDGALRPWETWTQREGEMVLSAVYSHSVGQSGATANWQEPQAAMLSAIATGPETLILPQGVIGVRCQWVPLSNGGRYLDMRLQYDSAHLFGENFIMADVDSLGFSQEQLRVIQSLRQLPGGMRLFAGPVNQGKTTTLRVCLNRRMAETNMQLNCLLVEDPPEGGVVGARQVGVSSSVKDDQREKSFVEIMRCALRLDPDIVMLGEVRDIQTAQFAFRLALTGRQVYTTTHVYSALAIPQRLRDIGIDPYLVYDHHLLRGMICQRLLRGLCSHCRISLRTAPEELGPIYHDVARRVRAGLAIMDASRQRRAPGTSIFDYLEEPDLSDVYVVNPEGCSYCFGGRSGRTVCAEVIETDQKLMEMLAENHLDAAQEYWLSPNDLNGVTMLWHSLEKIRRGEVSPLDAEFEVGPLARDREILAVEEKLGVLK